MATTTLDDRPTIAPPVRSLLRGLRRRIRQYVWLEGCAAAVAWLGAAFWATLTVDWLFEPAPAVRAIMLLAVAAVLAAVLVRWIGRRAFVPISDGNAAMLLERRFPQLGDALLTAVMLGDGAPVESRLAAADHRFAAVPAAAPQPVGADVPSAAKQEEADDLGLQMLARTCREAAVRTSRVEPRKVFNPRPLWLHCGAASVLLASVVFFAVLESDAFATWARRALALSGERWPRKTHFAGVDGFPDNTRKVARGSDLEVVAKADITWPNVPEVAEVRYRMEGARGRATMDRRGIARGAGSKFQEYAYVFRNIPADIHFDVVGGDDRISDLWIQAVDSPTIGPMTLECQLPAYIGRRQQQPLPVTGVMQIPMGSRVTVHAGPSNKDLVRVQITSIVGDQPAVTTVLDQRQLDADHRRFSYALGTLMKETTLLFSLTDSDGITPQEPVRLALAATPDQPPQLAVRLDGIGTAITPQARVAVAGRITDDYGIGRVWFEHVLGDGKPGNQTIAKLPEAPALFTLPADAALEVRELGVKPGQKLMVAVKAADLCNLGAGPNSAGTERWLLEIVTPQQLRDMLDLREAVLRQRFEALIQEMTETRDVLARLQFETKEEAEKGKGEDRGPGTSAPGSAAGKGKSAEPGDEEPADSPARQRTLRLLAVEGTLSNCRKNTQEVLGLAEDIDDILKQLINNRIDTRELRERLGDGVAKPLHRMAEQMLPELERRLDALSPKLDDPRQAPALRDRAQEQAQAILNTMQAVLSQMIYVGRINELVKAVQEIVDKQEQLGKEIQKRHDEKFRNESLKENGP